MEIYADPITVNCRKVLAGLQMMGVDYKLSHIDYFQGKQKSLEYLAINPNAVLPAMRDGGLTLWESNSILQYAADAHGKSAFYPTDLKRRADVNRWLFWECGAWFPSAYVYLFENCVKPLIGMTPDLATIEKEAPNFHKLAGLLDTRLGESAWLCGDGPTIADIAVASAIHLHHWQKVPLGGYKHLSHWMFDKVEALPAWKNTMVYDGFTLQKQAA